MQNLSDRELDDLMKKANESQSYPYDADSWSALSDKLDRSPKRGFASGQAPLLIIIAGMVLTSSLYFTMSKQTPISGSVAASMMPEKEEGGNQVKVIPVPTNATGEKALVKDESNSSSAMKNSRENRSQRAKQKSSTGFKQSDDCGNSGTTESDNPVQQREGGYNSPAPEEQQVSPVSAKPVRTNFSGEEIIVDSAAEKVEVQDVKSRLKVKDSVEIKKNEQVRTSRFAIKLLVSPDFSSENFSKTEAVGWNYGGVLEYTISNALALSAGLLNTRKYYTAEDVTYGKYTAELAEGDCQMWDIPVNVHYYILSRQSLQLIASLGFSSYIMKQENYIYYPDETNKDRKYYSEINNKNKEWFKIVNVSIAAQLPVSPVLFLQVEPFIKVPLAGLGEGNISLSSFGTFFTVKYQLFTKNTRNNVLKK